MRIAIPTDQNTLQTTICMSFGRTPYFMIYDTETKEHSFLDNSAAASEGGAGIKAAQHLIDHKVSALLTPRCGKNAADVLASANILLFKTKNDVLSENLEAFTNGTLSILDGIHPGFHNHGK